MRKKTRHYPLIYTRYLFPIIADITILILFFIPNISFTLDTDQRQTMSLARLIQNTWDNSRLYLFSAQTQQTNDGILFYKSVFTVLIILLFLFILGFVMNLFSTIASGLYLFEKRPKITNIYTSIVPNRIVMLAFSLFLLPLTFFPDILVSLYRNLLLYDVSVKYTFISSGIMSTIVLALFTIITILSRKKEILLNINMFDYKKAKNSSNIQEKSDNSDKTDSARHYSLNATNTESIRELLGLPDDQNSDDDDSQK